MRILANGQITGARMALVLVCFATALYGPAALGEQLESQPAAEVETKTKVVGGKGAAAEESGKSEQSGLDTARTESHQSGEAPPAGLVEQKAVIDQTADDPASKSEDEKPVMLRGDVSSIQILKPPPFQLSGESTNHSISPEQAEILSKFEFELIIDRSLSMKEADCPGGLSRWDWCAAQAMAIANALAPYTPEGQTITRFAHEYDVHEHVKPRSVQSLLEKTYFQSGTRLAEPLSIRLNNYLVHPKSRPKRLLIAVITDGCPEPSSEQRLVKEALVNASHRMVRPDEVTVVFLQVGDDESTGRRFLTSLGTSLKKAGARYQFVRTKTFDEVQTVGLAQCLVDCTH